uniref:Uncharacterized protein n=1 Tax=Rhizophora mucronata TaxID=61149 RepID=A0A2P2QNP0_RHIMU
MQGMICTQRRNGEHQLGAIEFYGMEKVSNNYLMSLGNPGSQTIGQFMAFSGRRLSLAMAD